MFQWHAMLLPTLCLAMTACADDIEMRSVKENTRKQFPDIEHVEPAKVASWMEEHRHIILLDVREEAEFRVSHLGRARQMSPGADADTVLKTALADRPKDARIVLYCSVGVRSATLAKRLKDAGVKHVYNMNGSIFQWANEGRPVFQGDQKVSKVHPYSRKWGQLLKPELRADVKDGDGS